MSIRLINFSDNRLLFIMNNLIKAKERNTDQNGSSPYTNERKTAAECGSEEGDQERGERDYSDDIIEVDKDRKGNNIFPSKVKPES